MNEYEVYLKNNSGEALTIHATEVTHKNGYIVFYINGEIVSMFSNEFVCGFVKK